LKIKLVMGAFVIAALAALVLSVGVFAQTSGTISGNSNNSGCQLIDHESAGTTGATSSTGTGSTSGSAATPAATQAATATPAAAATSAATPSASTGPSGSTSASSTPAPTATSSSGSTGSAGTGSSGFVSEPHETPFCANGAQADVAVPNGGSASLSTAGTGSLIPVTGASTGSINHFTSSSRSATLSVKDKNGAAVNAAHMEICFKDASGNGRISQWYDATMWATWYKSATTPARWIGLPTTHNGDMACAQSWLPGLFMLGNQ
jgi:hypothetical protein